MSKPLGSTLLGVRLKSLDGHMAVVIVSHVSVTSGHQLGQIALGTPSSSSPSGKPGRTLGVVLRSIADTRSLIVLLSRTFAPAVSDSKLGHTLTPHRSKTPSPQKKSQLVPSGSSPKGKGKAQVLDESDNGDVFLAGEEEEDFSEEEVKPKPRRRPRKDVVKDAAKRMKKI
ncbi:hypothetical protein PCASD_22729 [Puccinia coronata f. sp. avenae]|uniref:Uncharacterized protein n=1 Tax=Puccinia coronata f. sp. avenae TaxID=200324 RepID=A0A2N5T4J2_9BASI|nr:hypothetical protein PCASD_22729 [Puccinia coronata f. sp. avenae]